MYVITRWHISSVTAPHISICRALSSQAEAGFLGNSFLLRCPKGRRCRCYVWTVVRSIQSISLVSRKMVENHSLTESVMQEVQSNIGCVWCCPILHESLDIKWQTSSNELSTGLRHHAQGCVMSYVLERKCLLITLHYQHMMLVSPNISMNCCAVTSIVVLLKILFKLSMGYHFICDPIQ